MAIQDFNTQMANITRETNMDTARVSDMAGKAGRDTIDQLLGALKSYKEGMQKDKALGLQERDIMGTADWRAADQQIASRGLDLKEKDITGTADWRAADLTQREKDRMSQADYQNQTVRNVRDKNLYDSGELAHSRALELQRLQNEGRVEKKTSETDPELNMVFNYLARPVEGGLVTDPMSEIPRVKWSVYSKAVPIVQARKDFELAMNKAGIKDERKRAAYRDSFEYWYGTGSGGAGLPGASTQPQANKAMVPNPAAPPPAPFGELPAERTERLRHFPEKAKMTQQLLDELVRKANMER